MPGRRMQTLRRRALAALTVLLVLALAMHPELAHLSALLDAVGLDTFLLLLEVQALALLGAAWRMTLRPLWTRAWPPLRDSARTLYARVPLIRATTGFCDDQLMNHCGWWTHYAWLRCRTAGNR